MNAILLAILAYVLVQFCIGAWLSRGMRNDTDYIVAGRSLTLPLVMFPVFATFFGSEALTATSAAVYDKGLSGAFVDPFCYGAAIIIVGLFLAARLRERELVTFADLFRNRFSPSVESWSCWCCCRVAVLGGGADPRVRRDAELDGRHGPRAGPVHRGDRGRRLFRRRRTARRCRDRHGARSRRHARAVADGVCRLGRARRQGDDVGRHPRRSLDVVRRRCHAAGVLEKIAVPVCGTIVAVELISRFLGARTSAVAAWGTVLGGVLYIAFGLLPIYLGFAGTLLMPGIKETEEIVPKLAETYLHGASTCCSSAPSYRPCSRPCIRRCTRRRAKCRTTSSLASGPDIGERQQPVRRARGRRCTDRRRLSAGGVVRDDQGPRRDGLRVRLGRRLRRA